VSFLRQNIGDVFYDPPGINTLHTRPLKRGGVRHASVVVIMTQSDDDTPMINCPKSTPPPSIWRLLKEHNLSSCKFSGRSARGICPVTKIHIFLYRNSHVGGGGQSSHAILLTCNAATYFSRYSLTAKILDFGEWGFLGGTTPKGETCLGRYVTSCKISRRSVSPSPRYLFPHK